jgi:SSS family solute:Na+ symporter
MGGADQAFQVIQEYSGFVFPGLVIIFGLGLLWKRSSGTAAVVTAVGTFVFSIAFKFLMPDVPFLLRMGYVFFCLLVLFIPISMADKKVKEAEKLSPATVKWQLVASRIFFSVAVLSAVAGAVLMHYEWGRNLGFEAIFFFATAMAGLGWTARNNAKSYHENIKSIGVDVSVFQTSRAFNIGAIAIVVLFILLYVFLW